MRTKDEIETLKPSVSEKFEESLDHAQEWAASVGYTEKDVDDIIKSTRSARREKSRLTV